MLTNDPSFRSLELLNKYLSQYLDSKVHFIDLPESKNTKTECSHVIATGLFYQRIFELDYWPEGDFQLHCLCHSVKDVLVELFGFDNDCINVIDRYELLPKSTNEIKVDFSKNFNLIYSGRISPQKNIEFLIFINFYFQLLYNIESKLILFGHFDNEHHRDRLNIHHLDYEKKIAALIDSLPWPGEKPSFITHLNSDEWITHVPSNSAFISASNLISEDYSMSVAQLQNEKPIPLILPIWGAFKNVLGDNVYMYNSDQIATTYDSLNVISKKAKVLATTIVQNRLLNSNKINNNYLEKKLKINKQYLSKKIEQNKLRWGANEIEFIESGLFYKFANTEKGQTLLNQYKIIFSRA